MPKFWIADYAPDLADEDSCTLIETMFESDDADDAVVQYAEDLDWSDGYNPVEVFVRDEDGVVTRHEITVEFDPVFHSGAVRVDFPRPAQSWCDGCASVQRVIRGDDGAHRFVVHGGAIPCSHSGKIEERFIC